MLNLAKFGAGCFWVLNSIFLSQDLLIPVLIYKCRGGKIPKFYNFPRLTFEKQRGILLTCLYFLATAQLVLYKFYVR